MIDGKFVIEALGLESAKVHGDELKARCPNPAHNDRSPSFGLNLSSGYYNCFGCGFKGKGLVSLFFKLNKKVPVGMDLKGEEKNVLRTKKAVKVVVEVRDAWLSFLTANGRLAYDVLKDRGVDKDVVKQFRVGYNPSKNIMFFPCLNREGKLLGWSERSDDWENRWKVMPFGIEKEKLLYGEQFIELGKKNVVYLVEGMVDCLKMWQWGFKAVAVFGSELLEGQCKRIVDFAEQVIIIPDNDKGGLKLRFSAMTKLQGKVKLAGVNLPDGIKDIGQKECTFEVVKDAIRRRISVR